MTEFFLKTQFFKKGIFKIQNLTHIRIFQTPHPGRRAQACAEIRATQRTVSTRRFFHGFFRRTRRERIEGLGRRALLGTAYFRFHITLHISVVSTVRVGLWMGGLCTPTHCATRSIHRSSTKPDTSSVSKFNASFFNVSTQRCTKCRCRTFPTRCRRRRARTSRAPGERRARMCRLSPARPTRPP